MAQLLRPLILSPATKCSLRRSINHVLSSTTSHIPTGSFTHHRLFTTTSPTTLIHRKNLHVTRSRGLRPADAPLASEISRSDSESDSVDVERKSRNEKKREARRAVRWGMELASFSDSQIKRILRVVSLEKEVFDALMLVKRLGRDVREGKRRQFSYIGRLLRDVEPELMDALIRATKDGDQQTFRQLAGSVKPNLGDISEEEEIHYDDEDEGFGDHHDIAAKWFDGLVKKDVDITNEIYSLSTVDFDRQELRKLVRTFCSLQARDATSAENEEESDKELSASAESEEETDKELSAESEEETEKELLTSGENEEETDKELSTSAENEKETDKELLRAKKLLTRFLVTLAKQLPTEENYML